jgi:hypothetical protein
VTAAVFGLVGVIVGGLITGGVNYFLGWRQVRSRFLTAQRIVAQELDTIGMELDVHMEAGVEFEMPEAAAARFMSEAEWIANQYFLAAVLTDAVWIAVSNVYRRAYRIRFILTIDIDPGDPLPEDTFDLMRILAEDARTAKSALLGARPPKFRELVPPAEGR